MKNRISLFEKSYSATACFGEGGWNSPPLLTHSTLMATPSPMSDNLTFLVVFLLPYPTLWLLDQRPEKLLVFLAPWLLLTAAHAQEIQTLELSTGEVHPLTVRIGNACLIQLPVEPIATNVGDPVAWLVEKSERIVSIKPTQETARDTNLAIVTRQGTLSFSVHLASNTEACTQMVRVTKIIDDSRPLPAQVREPQETLADTIIREIRIARNYYALKTVNSPELKGVEQFTQMRETGGKSCACILLQTFRFRDTRHLILHFVTENRSTQAITFDVRKTMVSLGDTFFAPAAVSLGRNPLPPKASAENFIILDGSNGLSPRQLFDISLSATTPSPSL